MCGTSKGCVEAAPFDMNKKPVTPAGATVVSQGFASFDASLFATDAGAPAPAAALSDTVALMAHAAAPSAAVELAAQAAAPSAATAFMAQAAAPSDAVGLAGQAAAPSGAVE